MDSKFPGLDSYKMEKKVSDIENSIQNSLIDNSEKNQGKIHACYIVTTFFACVTIILIIYYCVKFL